MPPSQSAISVPLPQLPPQAAVATRGWISKWGVVHQAVASTKWWPFAAETPEDDGDDDAEVVAHNRHADLKEARTAVEASVAPLIYAIATEYEAGVLQHYLVLVTGTELMKTPVRYVQARNTPKLKYDDSSLPGQLLPRASDVVIAPRPSIADDTGEQTPQSPSSPIVPETTDKPKETPTVAPPKKSSSSPLPLPSLIESFRPITPLTQCRLWLQDAMYGPHTPENHIYSTAKPIQPKAVVVIAFNQWVPPRYARRFAGPTTLARRLLEPTVTQVTKAGAEQVTAIAIDGLDTMDNSVAHLLAILAHYQPQLEHADLIVVVAAGGAVCLAIRVVAQLYEKALIGVDHHVAIIGGGGYIDGSRMGLDLKRGFSPLEAEVIDQWTQSLITDDLALILRHQGKVTLACDPYDDIVAPESAWACRWSHPHLHRVLVSRHRDSLVSQVMRLIAVLRNRGVVSDHGVVAQVCGDFGEVGSHLWLITDSDAISGWIEAGLAHLWSTTRVLGRYHHPLHVVKPPAESLSLFDAAWNLRAVVEQAMTQPHMVGIEYLADIERARAKDASNSRLSQALAGLPMTEIDQWWS